MPLQWLFSQDREVLPLFLVRQICLSSRHGQPTPVLLGRGPDFCEETVVAVAVKNDLTVLAGGTAGDFIGQKYGDDSAGARPRF